MRFHVALRASALLLLTTSIASRRKIAWKAMPIYPHYTQMRTVIESTTRFESPDPIWSSDGSALEYRAGGKWHHLDIAAE